MTCLCDLIYDAELLIEDEGKYYRTKINSTVVDGDGIVVKVILFKGERVFRKDLCK